MCGKDREVSGDVLVSIRALHQPSQAQHLTLLAQVADEGDEPAHDRRLSCQPLPAHESGVSHRTLPPALPRGLRGSGGVIESHRGTRGGKTDRQFVFAKHLFFASSCNAEPGHVLYFAPSALSRYVLGCWPPHLQSLAIQIPPTDGQKSSMHQPTSRTDIPPNLRRSLF